MIIEVTKDELSAVLPPPGFAAWNGLSLFAKRWFVAMALKHRGTPNDLGAARLLELGNPNMVISIIERLPTSP